jgi:hypothetical protein
MRRGSKKLHRRNSHHTLSDKVVADTAAIAYEHHMQKRGVVLIRHRHAVLHLLQTIGTHRRTGGRVIGRMVLHDRTPLVRKGGSAIGLSATDARGSPLTLNWLLLVAVAYAEFAVAE